MKHSIWNNTDMLEETAHEIMDNPELYDIEKGDEYAAWELAHVWNDDRLDDEFVNLDIDVGYPIVVFAGLGLWDGHRTAYRMLGSQNLKDCLKVCCGMYIDWFVDEKGDLVVRDTHHDGTNVYTFRALRGGMSWEQIENFYDKLDSEGITKRTVKRYTRRLGDYAAKVYGWKLPGGVHA